MGGLLIIDDQDGAAAGCGRRRAALSATSALASGAMAGTPIAKVEPLPGVLDGDVAAQHAAEVPGDG